MANVHLAAEASLRCVVPQPDSPLGGCEQKAAIRAEGQGGTGRGVATGQLASSTVIMLEDMDTSRWLGGEGPKQRATAESRQLPARSRALTSTFRSSSSEAVSTTLTVYLEGPTKASRRLSLLTTMMLELGQASWHTTLAATRRTRHRGAPLWYWARAPREQALNRKRPSGLAARLVMAPR